MTRHGNKRQPQQNVEKKALVPSRGSRLKQPPADLAEFIKLANLVPEGYWLPPGLVPNPDGLSPEKGRAGTTWAELQEKLHDLPEAVRAELIARSRQVAPTPEELTWCDLDTWRIGEVLSHYEKIRVAYYNLRGLTRRAASLDLLENLIHALFKADLGYLRRCAYEKCGKIFYAGRSVQPGCKPAHSSALRKQRKRETDRLGKQIKRDQIKKRAQTARKR